MGDLLGGYLRTRIALGEDEIYLNGMTRGEALAAARRLASRPAVPVASATPVATETGDTTPGSDAELERLGRIGSREEIRALPDLTMLDSVAQRCTRCDLHGIRKTVVFGEGDPKARLVCVGEAPGAREDETGRPFVGRAGQLLDRLLLAVGFQRNEVFICNVLKCRPPQNRNPQMDEIEACSPFLLRQIELIDPLAIVAFGSFAAQTLLQTRESIGRLRGRTHLYEGYPLVVTYHPAALLRNPRWTRKTWEDLQGARRLTDGDTEQPAPDVPDAGYTDDPQFALTPDG